MKEQLEQLLTDGLAALESKKVRVGTHDYRLILNDILQVSEILKNLAIAGITEK